MPAEERLQLSKGRIALELLDRERAEGLPGRVVVADAGYGVSGPFREGLAKRGLYYIVGVTDEMVVFTEEPRWLAPAGEPEGPCGPDSAPQGDLARGDRRADVGAASPGCESGRLPDGPPASLPGASRSAY